MAKYTFEKKLKMVLEYLAGDQSYDTIRRKSGMPCASSIKNWVANYNVYGAEDLKRRKTKTTYPLEFKLTVLQFIEETGSSYFDTARHFKLHNPSMIANLKRRYAEEGVGGLNKSVRRPTKMSEKKKNKAIKKPSVNSSDMERIKALEEENEYLRTEVAFLKKLGELQEKEDQTNNYSESSED